MSGLSDEQGAELLGLTLEPETKDEVGGATRAVYKGWTAARLLARVAWLEAQLLHIGELLHDAERQSEADLIRLNEALAENEANAGGTAILEDELRYAIGMKLPSAPVLAQALGDAKRLAPLNISRLIPE